MRTIYKYLMLGAVLTLGSCSKETPFREDGASGTGMFSKDALLFDVRDNYMEHVLGEGTRAEELDDFKIMFYKNGSTAPEVSYLYGEMPDVVILPVGTYTLTASKGDNVDAGWESPYYLGESSEFTINENEISGDIDPVVCKLENVKVSIYFAPVLSGNMSPDSYVEVKVGDNAGLQYTKETEGTAGHFRHSENVSLVATFHGTVEGLPTVETKSIESVQKGHHYKITFRLNTQHNDHFGEADASVSVDASVTTVDLEHNIVIGEDEDLGDAERPQENPGGDTPDDPVNNEPPTITGKAPIDIDAVNHITDGMTCILEINSTANGGFTTFYCDIESETLNAVELAGVGLNAHLDLIDPDDSYVNALVGLDFPVYVGGKKYVEFNLTKFMPMLAALGADTHTFRLTIGDDNGTTIKNLILKKE